MNTAIRACVPKCFFFAQVVRAHLIATPVINPMAKVSCPASVFSSLVGVVSCIGQLVGVAMLKFHHIESAIAAGAVIVSAGAIAAGAIAAGAIAAGAIAAGVAAGAVVVAAGAIIAVGAIAAGAIIAVGAITGVVVAAGAIAVGACT